MRILITGGAGFVGSYVARPLAAISGNTVIVLDNLRRRGSELNLESFRRIGIKFVHGDIRKLSDLSDVPGNFDLLIEASAEPSVHAGHQGSPAYVIGTNLQGTLNCLEFARARAGRFIYLSTSRVYSISALRQIRLLEDEKRFDLAAQQSLPGLSSHGVAEDFSKDQARSFYGATKLASEIMIQEYVETYGLEAVINRCGVIAGPGQFGKLDQGIFCLWIAHHCFRLPLKYTGFGGTGKQVRDLLHPADLLDLLQRQLDRTGCWQGEVFNVGGGRATSVSLREMTDLCREIVGWDVPVEGDKETASVDIPFYVSDHRKASQSFNWQPLRSVRTIVSETAEWIRSNEQVLRPIFGAAVE